MKHNTLQILLNIGDALLWLCVLAGFCWAFGAIWFSTGNWPSGWKGFGKILAVIYLAIGIFLIRRSLRKSGTGNSDTMNADAPARSRRKWVRPMIAASVGLVYLAMVLFVQASNDRQWALDQLRLPEVSIDRDQVTIRNVRDFRYATPEQFTPRYQTIEFDIRNLESVWFVVQRFTRFNGMAHTFLSFEIDTPQGKQYFSISVEIRREQNELYSPLAGLFRQYELMYVVGTEQDLIGVRTNVRDNDRVFLYRTNASKPQVQQLFRSFAERISELQDSPQFYHTLLSNCTNNIVALTWPLTPEPINPLSPRVILPGYSPQVAFDHGFIGESGQTFEQLQQASRIDTLASEAGIGVSFSRDIRKK